MKKALWFIPGILLCIIVIVVAYVWATKMISSLYDFRSPLHNNPPQPGQTLGTPLTRKVVAVLIDAERVDTSLRPEVMPFLNELRKQAAWATIHSRPPSYSDPGYSVLMTGAWPDMSDGPAMNLEYADTPTWTQDNLFSAAHRAGLKTAVSGYYWFEKLIPQQDVSVSFYTPGEDAAADVDVMNAALPWLSLDYQFVLIHIDQVDYAGHHLGGPRDLRWDQASSQADNYVREIAARLDLKQDTLVIFSDHGQIDRGGHGGQDPATLVEPFVMVGAGVLPGHYADIQQVDVAPTIAALLGTNIPASSQGHVLTDMLVLPTERLNAIQAALGIQQSQLQQAYIKAIGAQAAKVTPQPGQDLVNVYQRAMSAAQGKRLSAERLGRIPLALLVALIPIIIMLIRKKKKVFLLLAGALFYTLLFNLYYAVIGWRTYSLSSVESVTGIIVFTAVTAMVALIIAWLGTMFLLRAFGAGACNAAGTTLSFTLMTLYLLSLPILAHVALNGVLITWNLPDFLFMFLGFLSMLQMLVIAGIGLILTGFSAGIGKLLDKPGSSRSRIIA